MDPGAPQGTTETRMESRYAQERVGSSCRARFASPAANRVRGIVGIVEHLGPGHKFDRSAAGQATSADIPTKGSTVLIVQKSALGYVLALANGHVVYTYAKDTKGGTPACTGSCASAWPPVTGIPVASAASTGLGTFGTVTDVNGAKQITYDGMPLYTFKGDKALATKGNGIGGMWHVIKLSKSNITGT